MAGLPRQSGYTAAMDAGIAEQTEAQSTTLMPTPAVCRRARLARDARFDGLFFTGVKTTGIFCRPVCPAGPPKEVNVTYFASAFDAAQAGLRPCLRCRPEAAPGSPAWRGAETTLSRAVGMIDRGEWREQTLPDFAERLGVSDRYLRKLFQRHLGVSPLKYANYRRALLAKQLLHQTHLPVVEIAHIAGFGSTRRFNAVFFEVTGFSPRQLRRKQLGEPCQQQGLTVFLNYRPPYHWAAVRDFYRARQIVGLECVTEDSYARSISHKTCRGWFVATHVPGKHGFRVRLALSQPKYLMNVLARIRRLLDLDAEAAVIAGHLGRHSLFRNTDISGIRLPGVWSTFEAGARAILGQQVSVKAAHNLVARLVDELGENIDNDLAVGSDRAPSLLFPNPESVSESNLEFLAMPGRRKQALRLLARLVIESGGDCSDTQPRESWLSIPGLGSWTLQYARFRLGNPDIFLAGDLGVKNALKKIFGDTAPTGIDNREFSPWGSYATLLLWQSLAKSAALPGAR